MNILIYDFVLVKMLKMQAGLTLFVLVLNLSFLSSNGWDVGVAVRDRIQFLTASGHVVGNVSDTMTDVSGLAYNRELVRMYFVDNRRPEGSVFELTLPPLRGDVESDGGQVRTVVGRQERGGEVKGVVYDPMTGVLYWSTGKAGSVWWVQVQSSGGPQVGQPLFSKEDMLGQVPVGLAIDVCRRFLYWTNLNRASPSIERARLSGSERRAVVSAGLVSPNAVTVDQGAERLYWVDERFGEKFSVESSDLDGNNRLELYNGKNHQPFALAVAANSVFWVDHVSSSVWRIALNSSSSDPQFVREYSSSPLALVSSEVGSWRQGLCDPIIRPRTEERAAVIVPVDAAQQPSTARPQQGSNWTLCLHGGTYVSARSECYCAPGYSGERCEVSECLNYCVHGECAAGPRCHCAPGYRGPRCDQNVCHNFCLHGGSCHTDSDDQPECACREGYRGVRCEVRETEGGEGSTRPVQTSVCHNYCVMGECSVDIIGRPMCHCQEGFSGDRCEVNYTQHQELRDSLRDVCKEFCLLRQSSKAAHVSFSVCDCGEYEFVAAPEGAWVRQSPLVGVLGVCLLLLLVAVVFLAQRVMVLRRRPRVKKRIIVSKSVAPSTTPMTCRPDSECHEITIENCCNMNICETPCYEPEFRQPEPGMSRSERGGGGREDMKSLLRNMELPPDDLY